MVALCEDAEVMGAPFYVMERVAGTPYSRAAELELLGAERTRADLRASSSTRLVELHAVDSRGGRAGRLRPARRLPGAPGGALEEAAGVLDAAASCRGMDELAERLDASIPDSGEGTIVHGDYRLDNVLVDSDDRRRMTPCSTGR